MPYMPGDLQPGTTETQTTAVWSHSVPAVSREAVG